MRGRDGRRERERAAAKARVEEIQQELADPDSETSQSVRRVRRKRNAGVLGVLLPLVVVAAGTGIWFVPVSWAALVTGMLYAGLLVVTGVTARVLTSRDRVATAWTYLLIGVLSEAVRLGLVALLDAGRDEAVWLALGCELAYAFAGSALGTLAVFISHTERLGKGSPTNFPLWVVLAYTVSGLAAGVGFTLLLAWSPWLVFVTIPAGVASSWLKRRQDRAPATVLLGILAIGAAAVAAGLALFARLG